MDDLRHSGSSIEYDSSEDYARARDERDPLASMRERFLVPRHGERERVYFCGNSLGLQPRRARQIIDEELEDWAQLAVDAHFDGRRPWYSYHEQFAGSAARLVGARPSEVVLMNSLTVNLHLMMVSFYRPEGARRKILIDGPTFPSDIYAVKSQIAMHGHDPAEDLIIVAPRAGEHTVRTDDLERTIAEQGEQIALVLLSGVNFFSGQLLNIEGAARVAREHGCTIGLDLAHAAGNVPLQLHDWSIDFAAWCSYKYLNGGPGAVAGCFVHQRHGEARELPRCAGWWGNDPETRFEMHLRPDFVAQPGAAGWQLSNPPIFGLAPLVASFEIFDEAGMRALRGKSEQLTGYLQFLLDEINAEAGDSARVEVITPRDSQARGCQLSLLVHDRPAELRAALDDAGVTCDFRPPNVIRVAPVPLYNRYHDVWRFAQVLREL